MGKVHMMMVDVYALCEPDTGTVRYVGASWTPKGRYASHVHGSDKRTRNWVMALRKKGQRPVFRLLQRVRSKNAADTETKWIRHYAPHGRLLNKRISYGGYNVPSWCKNGIQCIDSD